MPAAKATVSEPVVWEEIQPFTEPITLEIGEETSGFYRGANEVTVPDTNEEGGTRTNLLHEFSETPDGETWGLWGSAGLDRRLAEVQIGTQVRVRYDGKRDLEGGRTVRQYRVWAAQAPF